MANDVIKNFDEEVTKNQELSKSKEVDTTEEVVKSNEVIEEVTVEVVKSTETDEAVKSDTPKEDEKTETVEKSDNCDNTHEDKDVEKSEDEPEPEKADAEKSEDKPEDEPVAKSDVDFEGLLEVVIKSYSQLAEQVTALAGQVNAVASTQETISKSIEDSKVTPIQESEAVSKSVELVSEPEGKAVGYAEKSVVTEESFEEASKSNVDTAPVQAPEFDEVQALFKSKFSEASKNIKSARDENKLSEVSKSWHRYLNDRATSVDTDRINNFLNSK